MRPFCRELKLRADVFHMKKSLIDTTTQLDLNATARRNDTTEDKFSPYMMNSTYAVLSAQLAYALGSFNEKTDLAAALEKQQAD